MATSLSLSKTLSTHRPTSSLRHANHHTTTVSLSSTSSSLLNPSLTLKSTRATLPPRAATRATVISAAVAAEADVVSVVDKSVNTIRFLAIDAVEKANSGHPGLPMGCAPMGHILYDEVMRFNPKNPYWFNRDRFVLSAGHGCMLQYALLHLAGYNSVTIRQTITWVI